LKSCEFLIIRITIGFDGYHGYDVFALKNKTELRETLKMNTYVMAKITWPLIFRPLHDAFAFTHRNIGKNVKLK